MFIDLGAPPQISQRSLGAAGLIHSCGRAGLMHPFAPGAERGSVPSIRTFSSSIQHGDPRRLLYQILTNDCFAPFTLRLVVLDVYSKSVSFFYLSHTFQHLT